MKFINIIKLLSIIASLSIANITIYPILAGDKVFVNILNDSDKKLYEEIFTLQQNGNWKQADKRINIIDDNLLMGHILYQRYMHPTKYRSKYGELKIWLDKYADHPNAKNIYKLALRRQPANYKHLNKPRNIDLSGLYLNDNNDDVNNINIKSSVRPKLNKSYRSSSKRRRIRQIQKQISRFVQRGNVTVSLNLLHSKNNKRLFDNISYAESLGVIARGYFRYHKDIEAILVAAEANDISPDVAIDAMWWGGLAAWRQKNYQKAAEYFLKLTNSIYTADITKAAAAYWASRSYLLNGQANKVNSMLHKAAAYKDSFYGLLANRALGAGHGFNWGFPNYNAKNMAELNKITAARRAIALVSVNQTGLAAAEFRRFITKLPARLSTIILQLADFSGAADITYRIASSLEKNQSIRVDAALYPMPNWQPYDGYKLDKALIFAFVRQESRYQPRAKSSVGARGLMQLMPATAGFVAGRRFTNSSRDELFDISYNLSLGQGYLQYLLNSKLNGGNLFYLAAAYNGGPGNLQKWMNKVDYQDDPLLFIETIPSRETRLFIEHVLSNLWIYRYRMGQETPSLDAILAGNWPIYIDLDKDNVILTNNSILVE